jgi:Tannase and feruloyl esterase
MAAIDVSKYVLTDSFFGTPYLDEDTEVDMPVPHRMIHGGFEGTATRFRFYFPPKDAGYQGRMFNPLSGGNGGTEDFFATPLGDAIGGLSSCLRLGGYMVESNQGHIGDELDPKGGEDPTLYGWRASAEVARFSKFVAEQIYGQPPHHSYVFGGSGGARRSPLCLAYAPDAWDGALPFMGDAMDGEYGDFRRLRTAAQHFCSMFNVQRVLGERIEDLVDAVSPGGRGDPFTGLDTHQREELATLYRLGYPRGDELMITQQVGQIWLWSSMAERLQTDYPEYWEAFWTKPGHVGFDQPGLVQSDVIDTRATVSRVLTAQDVVDDLAFAAPEYSDLRRFVQTMAQATGTGFTLPCVIEVKGIDSGYRLGTGVRVTTGQAAGRQLYCLNSAGDFFFCDAMGEASNLRFGGVLPGDEVHVDNHAFLAFCYYYRHHIHEWPEYEFLRIDGRPIYPQYQIPEMSPFMGTAHTGRFEGKLMWVHHTHDASLWPSQGIGMKNNVERELGPEGAKEHFRLRWTENAEHGPASMKTSLPGRAANTWLIDYGSVIEQCLADLAAWVEQGIEPAGTAFEYKDGKVTLPPTAAERGGIQPVVSVTANGDARADVKVGEQVTLAVHAEVPPGAGTIIGVKWDFDGSGTYPFAQELDGTASQVTLSTTHAFERSGTYFATALVESHREGDVKATARRVPNLASARVVVE